MREESLCAIAQLVLRSYPLLQFLKALREQLTELHSLDLGVVLAPKTLQGYSFRVDALERILSARKQELRRFKAMEGSRPTGSGISTSTSTNVTSSARGSTLAGAALSGNAPPAPGPIVGSPLPISIRPGLKPPLPFSKVGKRGGAKEAEGIDRDLQEKVDREKEAQQMLTEQLGELVGALKASSMLVHSNLKTQNKVGFNFLCNIRKGDWLFTRTRMPFALGSQTMWMRAWRMGRNFE